MAQRSKPSGRVPSSVTRLLLEHRARGTKKVVVVFKKGIPSSVFDYDEYANRAGLPRCTKRREHRQGRTPTPEPLGGIDAGVCGPLSREDMHA